MRTESGGDLRKVASPGTCQKMAEWYSGLEGARSVIANDIMVLSPRAYTQACKASEICIAQRGRFRVAIHACELTYLEPCRRTDNPPMSHYREGPGPGQRHNEVLRCDQNRTAEPTQDFWPVAKFVAATLYCVFTKCRWDRNQPMGIGEV